MKRRRDAGFGLLELAMSVAIFATVLGSLAAVLRSTSSKEVWLRNAGSLDERAWRVTDAIARELRWAQSGSLLVTTENGSGRLDFKVPLGYAGGAVAWSTTITVKYSASNLDANANHKVDEGSLVRIQDGKARVLCDYVPAGGFTATQSGASVTLDLQLRVTDADHRVVSARAAESVSTRN